MFSTFRRSFGWLGFVAICFVGTTVQAQEAKHKSCLAASQLLAADKSGLVGYGEGQTIEQARNQAQLDLASQILVDHSVDIRDEFRDQQRSQSMQAQTLVSQKLFKAEVAHRCHSDDKGYAVVLVMGKRELREYQEEQLTSFVTQGDALSPLFATADTPLKRRKVLRQAVQLMDEAGKREYDLLLCRSLGGCAKISLANLKQNLTVQMQRYESLQNYRWQPTDDVSRSILAHLEPLLAKHDLAVAAGDGPAVDMVLTCREQVKPAHKDITFRFVELTCTATMRADNEVVERFDFAGKGMDESVAEAKILAKYDLQQVN